MTTTFEQLGLSQSLNLGLSKQSITTPTDIQTQAIPPLLNNEDVIGQAFTGSGKTLAYLCPLFMKIHCDRKEMQGLILAPTHELVIQIHNQIKLLAENSQMPVTSLAIIGEANIKNQMAKLKEKPHIIVGTPGRIWDLIQKRKINGQTVKTIVIDEVDNLLDNTNRNTVLSIIKSTQRDRQLCAFSASTSANTMSILNEQMRLPKIIKVMAQAKMNPNIEHYYIVGEQRDKFELLRKLINAASPTRALVFLNEGERIDLLADKLNYHHLKTFALHGSVPKEERKKAMEDFRKGNIHILVSSDLAARGLDIPDITHIINMDFPVDANEYIHRAGRTARGEQKGQCYSIVNPSELAALRIYQREFAIDIKPVHLVKGKILPGAIKQFYAKKEHEKKDEPKKGKKKTVAPQKAKTQSTKAPKKQGVKPPKKDKLMKPTKPSAH